MLKQNITQQSERDLLEKIAQCDEIITRAQTTLDSPYHIPSGFTTGHANRPRSLDRAMNAENNRRSKALNRREKARRDKSRYESQLHQLKTGETPLDPVAVRRTYRNQHQERITEAGRAVFKVGMLFRVLFNPHGGVWEVKSVNKNGITDTHGETWRYDEVIPDYLWERVQRSGE